MLLYKFRAKREISLENIKHLTLSLHVSIIVMMLFLPITGMLPHATHTTKVVAEFVPEPAYHWMLPPGDWNAEMHAINGNISIQTDGAQGGQRSRRRQTWPRVR